MQVKRITGDLADPAAAAWAAASSESVTLVPVPLEAQPTEYIRVAWAERPYGNVDAATVAAARDGDRLYVRLEWADSDTPNTEFHDAAAALFPSNGSGSLATIGDDESPLRLWYWQADLETARDLDATGPGAFTKRAEQAVSAAASLEGGRWAVVLSSGLDSTAPARMGVAVWDGSNEERAGIGAVTPEWIPLEVED